MLAKGNASLILAVANNEHLARVGGETPKSQILHKYSYLLKYDMQLDRVLDKGPCLQMYTVPGNCMPLGWQTTGGSPSWT